MARENKPIRAYENETLVIVENNPDRDRNEISRDEADAIESLFEIEELGINESKWARRTRGNKLKLGQYVGLITVGDLSIEIVAKVEKESEGGPKTDLNKLIGLFLSDSEKSLFSAKSYEQKGDHEPDIMKHLVRNFFERVNKSLNFGLRCEYQTKEELLNNFKGRINFTQLATTNGRDPGKLPLTFEEFTQDTLHNQIIKQAVGILSRQRSLMLSEKKLRTSAAGILDQLEHVSDKAYGYSEISAEEADRLEINHAEILEFSKRVIAGNTPFIRSKESGKKTGFTMVWEMSAIYEKAVAIKVREFVKNKLHPDCEVIFQGKLEKDKGLLSPGHTTWNSYLAHSIQEELASTDQKPHTGVFRLKPDIMILSPQREVLAVLDTKWKNYSGAEAIRAQRRRKRYSDDLDETAYKNVSKEDAYQMLSYACAKKSGKDTPEPLVGLLFPSLQSNAPEELYFTNLKSRLHLCWVPVTEEGLKNFDLENILGSKALNELRVRAGITNAQDLASSTTSS